MTQKWSRGKKAVDSKSALTKNFFWKKKWKNEKTNKKTQLIKPKTYELLFRVSCWKISNVTTPYFLKVGKNVDTVDQDVF